jgi:predicted RecA/RadA family phage recombinase
MTGYDTSGEILKYLAGSTIASDDVVVAGGLVGIAMADIANGSTGPVLIRGIAKVAKKTGTAWTQGQQLYYDATNKFSTIAAGTTRAGIAAVAAGSSDATGYVLLNQHNPEQTGNIEDANGNEVIIVAGVTSAVNEITVTNAATTDPAIIAATGETNVGLTVRGNGTGTLQLGQATGKVAIATVGTDYVGFFGTTPAQQPAHVADPAAAAAITFAAGSIDTGTDMTAAQAAALAADLAALKAGIDANNAAIDSILAQLATLGLQAAS